MDIVFNRRICRAVEEQEIMLVLLQQLGIDVQTSDGSAWQRDDAIALQDLVQITKVVARTDISYLQKRWDGRSPGGDLSPQPLVDAWDSERRDTKGFGEVAWRTT
jgi:hypothetical protein